MTDLFPEEDKRRLSGYPEEHGAATLLLTVVAVVLVTLILIFAANSGILQDRSNANLNRQTQAFYAAEAGMEFAINYIKNNNSTVTAGPVNGYISYTNSSLTNVTLSNNSKFSVTITNPEQNNYKLLLITSTGTSDDGSSTKTIQQQVYAGSILANPPSIPLVTKGSLSLGGSSTITNTFSGTTVQSGSDVTISGSGSTVLASGTSSTSSQTQSDVKEEVSSLASQSQSDFFASYFGVPATTIKNAVTYYYSNSSSTNYSGTLNGKNGVSIWIDQTGGNASLSGNTTIGTAASPVLLVVNGNLSLSGTINIHGFVYVTGTSTTSVLGNVNITGGMVSSGNMNFTGSTALTYNPTILSILQSMSGMFYYAKVPGSWKDF